MASRRRRRAISVTGVASAVAAAYGTYRLVSWGWSKWTEEEDESNGDSHTLFASTSDAAHDNELQRRRRARAERIARCKIEARNALSDFLPTLRKTVECRTNFSSETRELKGIRAARAARFRGSTGSDEDDGAAEEEERERERVLWSALKIKSVSRMISTAYANTALLLVLTVQVHLLGGRLLLDEETQLLGEQQADAGAYLRKNQSVVDQNECDEFSLGRGSECATEASEEMASYQRSHHIVLTRTYEYFFDRGVPSLVAAVERAVSDVFAEWDVTDPSSMNITRGQFDGCINRVRSILEGRRQLGKTKASRTPLAKQQGFLVHFFVQPDNALCEDVVDDLALYILEETWDVLESPVFEVAEKECLDVMFQTMKNEGWGLIFASGKSEAPEDKWVARPLAQIVTQLRYTSNSFLGGSASCSPNSYESRFENIPSLVELGVASFSQ